LLKGSTVFKGLFDVQTRLAKIDKNGDPLVTLDKAIDWEIFRPVLAPLRERECKSAAGRKPYDVILMFKVLVLQSFYNLSDDRVEQLILDRLTFMRFLGLCIGDAVPDAKTIWLFRESMNANDTARALFDGFESFLAENGFQAQKGQIIDATIVEVPIQRNTRDENAAIKNGDAEKVRAGWTPDKAAQKDTDARWTKKNNESYFGYKRHDNTDVGRKLIRSYSVTDASVHDSKEFKGLLIVDETEGSLPVENVDALLTTESQIVELSVEATNVDPLTEGVTAESLAVSKVAELPVEPDMAAVYADSAYRSAEHESLLSSLKLRSHVMRKASRNVKLTEEEKAENRRNSKVRVRVEHVFGSMRQRMGDTIIRTVGLVRAKTKLGLRALVYNLDRYAFLVGSIA